MALQLDNVPPNQSSPQDRLLWRSLERAMGKLFFEQGSGVLQGLLTSCRWQFQNQSLTMSLIIHCPDQNIRARVLNHLSEISRVLEGLTPYAKVEIQAPYTERVEFELHSGHCSTS